MTQPTVTVPVIGTVERRWVFVGAAAVAVITAYAYISYRRRQQTPATYDPATGTPTQGGGYVNPVPGAVGSFDPISSNPDMIETNDEWVRIVISELSQLDWNAQFVGNTLGKYLAGAALTEDELALVRTAWGIRGKPPQGAPEPILGTPGVTNPPPAPAPTPAPAPAPAPAALPTHATATAGEDAYAFAHRHYGDRVPLDQAFALMEQLNPGIRTNIKWLPRPGNPYGNLPVFINTMNVRIR